MLVFKYLAAQSVLPLTCLVVVVILSTFRVPSEGITDLRAAVKVPVPVWITGGAVLTALPKATVEWEVVCLLNPLLVTNGYDEWLLCIRLVDCLVWCCCPTLPTVNPLRGRDFKFKINFRILIINLLENIFESIFIVQISYGAFGW